MASLETIQEFAQSEDLASATQQLVKMCKDKPDILKSTIETLAKQIGNKKESKYRVNYAILLTSVLKKNFANVSAADLLDTFRTSLPDITNKNIQAYRQHAYIICLACVSRSGMLKDNLQLVGRYVQFLFDIGIKQPHQRGPAFSAIADIAINNIDDSDTFMDILLPILTLNQPKTPKNIDALYMWTAIGQKFPKVTMLDVIKTPLTREYIDQFDALLQETSDYRPSIHPIWHLLASIDHKALLRLTNEAWVPDFKQHKEQIAYAATAASHFFEEKEVIEFIENGPLFRSALSFNAKRILIPALTPAIKAALEAGGSRRRDMLVCLLSVEGKHSFILQLVTEACTRFDDAATEELAEALGDAPFSAYMSLLWAQKNRSNIEDFKVVRRLFEAVAAHVKTDEEKEELSNFVGNNLMRMTPDGKTWFTLLTDVEFSLADAPQSLNELVDGTNNILEGVNRVNAVLGLEAVAAVSADIKELCAALSTLLRSPHEHLSKVGRLQLGRALPYMDASTASAIATDAELLNRAVRLPALCAACLPAFLERLKDLSKDEIRALKETPIRLPLTVEEASKVAEKCLNRCYGSEERIQEDIACRVVQMLPDEEQRAAIEGQIRRVLINGSTKGYDAITMLIRASAQTSFDVMEFLRKLAKEVKEPSRLELMRRWIGECCESSECPSDNIAAAVFAAIDYEWDDSNKGRKLCESALEWAVKLMKRLDRDVPRTKFAELSERVAKTGSRNAANMVRQLSALE